MSDVMSLHEVTLCLSERSEMLCCFVHKCTSYKYVTTIHSERVSYKRGTLLTETYPLCHIYIYIYIYNQRRSRPTIISRIPCSVEIMEIENLITETPLVASGSTKLHNPGYKTARRDAYYIDMT
jgi:hypothetical protein